MIMKRPLAAILDCNKTSNKRQKSNDDEVGDSKHKMEIENNKVTDGAIESSLALKQVAEEPES